MKSTKINTYSFIDSVGTPITGHLRLYEAGGTTTPVTAYDIDGNVLPTPIRLNGCGSIDIYLADNVIADAYLYDEDDFLVKTIRSVGAESGGSGSGVTQDYVDSHDTLTLNTAKGYTDTQVATKQNTLVSGTNIKTINNESILGTGNISVGVTQSYVDSHDTLTLNAAKSYADTHDTLTLNAAKSYADTQDTLTLNAATGYTDTKVATKQNTLVSGTNIKTINNESILGSGNISIVAPYYIAKRISNSPDEYVVTSTDLTNGYADVVINPNIDKYNCSMFVEVNNISAMSPEHMWISGSNFCDHIDVTFYENDTTDSNVGTITGTTGTLMKLFEDIVVRPLYFKFRVYFKSSHIVEAGYSIRLVRAILFIKC